MTDTARQNVQRARARQHEVMTDAAHVESAVAAIARLHQRQKARAYAGTFRLTVEQFDQLLEANRELAEVLTHATPLLPED
jgi:hypothetical protein